MGNDTPLLDAAAGPAQAFWRRLGRPLATTALAIAVALAIIHGESWALRQAPPLLVDTNAGCLSDDGAAASALPVAILH
jgi:hypothetical protein